MLNVPEAVKALFKTDGIAKNFRVHFPNAEYRDLTNSDIVAGSVKFTESVCSKEVLQFGLAEASRIEFECVGVPNIYGATIECFCEVDTSSLSAEYQTVKTDVSYPVYAVPYGSFRVQSCPRNAGAMTHRRVEGYGDALEKATQLSPFLYSKLSAPNPSPSIVQNVACIVAGETNDISDLDVSTTSLTFSDNGFLPTSFTWTYNGHDYAFEFDGNVTYKVSDNGNMDVKTLLRFICSIDTAQIDAVYEKANEYGIPKRQMSNLRGMLEPSLALDIYSGLFTPLGDPSDSGIIYPYYTGLLADLQYPSSFGSSHLLLKKDGTAVETFTLTPYISNVSATLYTLTNASQASLNISVKNTSKDNNFYAYIDSFDVGSLMEGYSELSAQFLQASRSGGLKNVALSKSSPVTISKSEHSDFWFDEYSISPIGSIKYTYYDLDLKQEQTQIYSFGEGLSEYDMTDNYLLKHLAVSASDLTDQTVEEYVQSLFDTYFIPNITDISFIPVDLDMIGLPYIEAGDYIEVVAEDNTVVGTYVLSRSLSGEQYLTDAVESKGGEIIGSSVRSA